MKFKAPIHVTGIYAAGEEVRADEDGIAELADDASSALVSAMLANGWTKLAAADEPAAPVVEDSKSSSKKPAEPPSADAAE